MIESNFSLRWEWRNAFFVFNKNYFKPDIAKKVHENHCTFAAGIFFYAQKLKQVLSLT